MDGGVTLSSLLTDFGSFVTWALTQLTALASWVVSTPLILAVVCIFFAGACMGLFIRMFHSV